MLDVRDAKPLTHPKISAVVQDGCESEMLSALSLRLHLVLHAPPSFPCAPGGTVITMINLGNDSHGL